MDGKVLEVSKAIDNFARYDEARPIDDVKAVVPWVAETNDGLSLNGKELSRNMIGAELQAMGLNAPLYHANCRTTVYAMV